MGAWDKTLTRKAQFVDAIKSQLRDNLAGFIARLSEVQRTLLAESAHQGRLIGPREFEARHGSPCPMPKRTYDYREEVSLLTAVICTPRYVEQGDPNLAVEVLTPLRALLPQPAAPRARTLPVLPKFWPSERQYIGGDRIRPVHVHEGERIVPAELGRVLRLIHGGKIHVADASRRPTDAATRLIGEALVVPDFALEPPKKEINKFTGAAGPVRAHAWGVLVQQCGWAKPHGGMLKLTVAGQAMLRAFSPEAFRAGVNAFLGDGDFDELNRVNNLRGQSGKARQLISEPGVRKFALREAMRSLPTGEWLDYAEARRMIEASGEEWDVQTVDDGLLYFSEAKYGVIYDMGGINSQFLRALFLESFATLGLMDVGFVYPHSLWPDFDDSWGHDARDFCGRYDGLLYVRINPLGTYALGLVDRYEYRAEPGPKLFRLLPNLEIHLSTEQLNPADRAGLELVAVPQDAKLWRLDPVKILTHAESGGDLAELESFLEANAAGGLPDTVCEFFESLQCRVKAFRRSREAVLLEWETEELALHLSTDPATREFCHHAGGNRLVVPHHQLTAFRGGVKNLGWVLPTGS